MPFELKKTFVFPSSGRGGQVRHVKSLEVSDVFLALTKEVAFLPSDFSCLQVSLKPFLMLTSKPHNLLPFATNRLAHLCAFHPSRVRGGEDGLFQLSVNLSGPGLKEATGLASRVTKFPSCSLNSFLHCPGVAKKASLGNSILCLSS